MQQGESQILQTEIAAPRHNPVTKLQGNATKP